MDRNIYELCLERSLLFKRSRKIVSRRTSDDLSSFIFSEAHDPAKRPEGKPSILSSPNPIHKNMPCFFGKKQGKEYTVSKTPAKLATRFFTTKLGFYQMGATGYKQVLCRYSLIYWFRRTIKIERNDLQQLSETFIQLQTQKT